MNKRRTTIGIITTTAIVILYISLVGCDALSPMVFKTWEFFEVEAQFEMPGIEIDTVLNEETSNNHYGGADFAISPDGDTVLFSFVDHIDDGDGDLNNDYYPVRIFRIQSGRTEELPSPGYSRNGTAAVNNMRRTQVRFNSAGVPFILFAALVDPDDSTSLSSPQVHYLQDDEWVFHSRPLDGSDLYKSTVACSDTIFFNFDSMDRMYFNHHQARNHIPQIVRVHDGNGWRNAADVSQLEPPLDPSDKNCVAWDRVYKSYQGKVVLDPDNHPYYFYRYGNYEGRLGVSRLNDEGTYWNHISRDGKEHISPPDVQNGQWDAAVGPDGTLYVAYPDSENGGRVTVSAYDGTDWTDLDGRGISDGAASWVNIVLSPDGIPYIAYADASHNGGVALQRYESGSWSNAAVAGSQPGEATMIGMRFARDGRLVYAYYSAESESLQVLDIDI